MWKKENDRWDYGFYYNICESKVRVHKDIAKIREWTKKQRKHVTTQNTYKETIVIGWEKELG